MKRFLTGAGLAIGLAAATAMTAMADGALDVVITSLWALS